VRVLLRRCNRFVEHTADSSVSGIDCIMMPRAISEQPKGQDVTLLVKFKGDIRRCNGANGLLDAGMRWHTLCIA